MSSVTCGLWLVNTQCVFSPSMPNNSGKISEHCMDMRVVLEGAQFFPFPGRTWGGCRLLCDSTIKLLKMWWRRKKERKKSGETETHKDRSGSDKRSPTPFEGEGGGITQARQMKFYKAAGNKYSRPSTIRFLICSLPRQCRYDTISKIKTSEGVNWMHGVMGACC